LATAKFIAIARLNEHLSEFLVESDPSLKILMGGDKQQLAGRDPSKAAAGDGQRHIVHKNT
jgi:hypothetical protein